MDVDQWSLSGNLQLEIRTCELGAEKIDLELTTCEQHFPYVMNAIHELGSGDHSELNRCERDNSIQLEPLLRKGNYAKGSIQSCANVPRNDGQSHPGDLYFQFKATSGFVYFGLLFKTLNCRFPGLLW